MTKNSSIRKVNETGRRNGGDRRTQKLPVAIERRKTQRRRQIDPTTCEREYTAEELEFMHALDQYKRTSGRMFPTCSELLEVFKGLGYRKIETEIVDPTTDATISMQTCCAETCNEDVE